MLTPPPEPSELVMLAELARESHRRNKDPGQVASIWVRFDPKCVSRDELFVVEVAMPNGAGAQYESLDKTIRMLWRIYIANMTHEQADAAERQRPGSPAEKTLREATYEDMVAELRRRRREKPEAFGAKVGETLTSYCLRNAPPLPAGPGIFMAADRDPFRDDPGFDPMLVVVGEREVLQIFDDGSFARRELTDANEDEVRAFTAEFRPFALREFRAAWAASEKPERAGS